MISRVWSRLVFWLRIGAASFAGAVGVLSVLRHYEVITLSESFDPTVWSISLAIIGVDNVGTLISRGLGKRRARTEAKLDAAMMTLLIQIAKSTSLRFEELGVSLYRPSRRPELRSDTTTRLVRVKRFRPAGYPLQSGIAWTSTTGQVGACWTSQRHQHKVWQYVAAKYRDTVVSPEQFERIPKETRNGFNCEQFNAIAAKYSEILAVPVWHGGKERKLVGVLTIDRAFVEEHDTFKERLGDTKAVEVASATASAVGRILYPSRDE